MSAGAENIPGMLEKTPMNRGGQAERGRRGRGVPRLRPRVVRHRRHHPGRRRLGREARVTQSPVAGAGRYVGARVTSRRGRAAAHRPRRVRRRHRAAGHAARVLRAQPVRARDAPVPSTRPTALARARRALRVHRRRPEPRRQGAVAHVDRARRARRRRARRSPRTRCASSAIRSRSSSPTSRGIAEDAAELVDVDYEPLPPVVDYTTAEHADVLVHASHGSNVIGEINGVPADSARRRVRRRRARGERDDLPAGVRTRADGRARPRRRLLARHGRSHDVRGDAVAARGAPVLLPPARHAGAPHPRASRATPAAGSGRRSWCSATRCA